MSESTEETDIRQRELALERLRDRTDELELIISSLTIFALFSLPGWVFGSFADLYTHLSTNQVIAGLVVVSVLTGFCYGLGACFVVHLMARAYWVGLIGLRWVFPEGINWERTPNLGPFSRDHYRESLPNLDQVITSTDRLASSLFAVISMLTLAALWLCMIMLVVLVPAAAIGAQFGMTNTGLNVGFLLLLVSLFGLPLLSYLLDAQLAARVSALRESSSFGTLITILRRVTGIVYPSRLLAPVQLTLQSNTRPFIFFIVMTLGITLMFLLGNYRVAAWQSFTLSSEFTYLDSEAAEQGFRSTFYEDMASSADRLRGTPRVDTFMQSGSYVRLFLPYQPLRDNLVLDEACTDEETRAEPGACLRLLWSVKIAGKEVPMSQFRVAQRADIGMRGLIGVVPLEGLEPGMQEIEVTWGARVMENVRELDDRYQQINQRTVIPIAFAPAFEMPLE